MSGAGAGGGLCGIRLYPDRRGGGRQGAEFKRRKAEQASQDGFEEAYAPGQFLKLCARQEGFGGHRPESQPLLGH